MSKWQVGSGWRFPRIGGIAPIAEWYPPFEEPGLKGVLVFPFAVGAEDRRCLRQLGLRGGPLLQYLLDLYVYAAAHGWDAYKWPGPQGPANENVDPRERPAQRERL